MTDDHSDELDNTAGKLLLLDRIAERMPEVNLDEHEIAWHQLPDGSQALLVNGGGIDGGSGAYFANAGADVHVVGSVDPLVEGYVGCIVVKPDGTRVLAQVMPDPLAPPSD